MLKRRCLHLQSSFRRKMLWSRLNWSSSMDSLLHPYANLHVSSSIGSDSVGAFKNGLALNGCFNQLRRVEHRVRGNGCGTVFAVYPQSVRDLGIGFQDCKDAKKSVKDEVLQSGTPLGFPYQPKSEKTMVAVDVDEVLGTFVSALNRFIADRYARNHSVSEYHVYEFFKIWKCSRDEADFRVHEFFKTPYFKTGIHPIPGALEALHKLSKLCDLCVVTSRQNVIKDDTVDWIQRYYPGLFEDIHFGNHFALDGASRRKSDICRSVGAKFLIDDNPRYAIECAEAGMRVLLFDYMNSYPWSKADDVDQHPLVTRVQNWKEVEQQLTSWIAS